ncbi:MAG TPA: hypothetical protein VG346_12145 [Acidimicrobiales bacterium]|nr:hypothetical protein [Acidimicrobiales bacterium]
MSFDEAYDEMLHGEFSSRGKHQAKAAAIAPEPAETAARARHAAAVEPAPELDEPPRGFQRYRTAALVGAGGMACAAAGAFLGGLGGYFTVSPAAAHPVASPTITQDLPLAQAVNQAAHGTAASSASTHGNGAVDAANFTKVSGSLTQGIAAFPTLTSEPLQNLPVADLPGLPVTSTGTGGTGTGGTGPGGTNPGGGGTGTGCGTSSSDLGLTCILQSLTSALGNLGSLSGGNLLSGLVPTLTGVVSDVTGTLEDLTSLLPIASLPAPTGGGTTVLAGAAASAGTGSSATSPLVSALSPLLNGVAALAGGALGSSAPSLPSLPLSSGGTSSVPSLPVTTTSGSLPAAPTVTTPSSGSSGGSDTINVPLPLPITVPTISIGGLSIGINSSDGSGLTLTLP